MTDQGPINDADKKLGIEVTTDLHRRFKTEASRRGLSLKDSLAEALELWLSGTTVPPSYGQSISAVAPNDRPHTANLPALLGEQLSVISQELAVLSRLPTEMTSLREKIELLLRASHGETTRSSADKDFAYLARTMVKYVKQTEAARRDVEIPRNPRSAVPKGPKGTLRKA